MSDVTILLVICVFLAGGRVQPEGAEKRWLNDYQMLHYVCPHRASISIIVSQHSNKTKDRVWDFACKTSFRGLINCSWTDYVNNFDEGINFSCPSKSLICGLENLLDDKHKDRRWKFYCCQGDDVCLTRCIWTPYINKYKEYFSWQVPEGSHLVGTVCYNDDQRGQRRWQYRYCAMDPC
ncbi:hemagglutinin/amebocyte aggregation factor-like isoform X2 [Heptranchias perlo]|uniref:hemagglutinin/amebocyte aggregation factor-like isoform X2 n=1 Tax=Heptranchias perlo TaxID=212740 RepID=UPI00355A230E